MLDPKGLEAATPPDELSGNPGELIDKMADAIRGDTIYDDTPWETLSEDRKVGWRDDAERALAVVKEYLTSQAATALRLSAGGGEKGQWKEIETNFRLKGWRTSPAYFPATGEVCEVSGPNCDDANGYTWMRMTVLWQNEKFVLYGLDGCWPNLHKREHVLFRPLPTSPTVDAGR